MFLGKDILHTKDCQHLLKSLFSIESNFQMVLYAPFVVFLNFSMYYESRRTLATQNINFKVCVTRFEDLRKTIAGNNRLDK